MNTTTRLRQMLDSGPMVVAPFILNALHAKIAESVGFAAVYMTGAGTAAERGFLDVGLLTMTEMVANAKYIAGAVEIPVICDADTGYGNMINVQRTVREYEAAGVAGIHIEDQVFPKKCGFFEGKQVIPMEEHVQKIRAALDARRDPDFVIIARCDADTGYGNMINVQRTVREYEAAGVAGIHIEDQVFPKKCGFFEGKQVIPMEEHVQKIRAALDARRDPDFVIIARCDAYAVTGWEDTVTKCRAYRDAGADMVFVDGIKTSEDLANYATDLKELPRMYNGDLAPTQEVDALGYRLMICGSTIWLVYQQIRDAFSELKETGQVNPERYGTRWDVAGLLGLDQIYELERKYGSSSIPVA